MFVTSKNRRLVSTLVRAGRRDTSKSHCTVSSSTAPELLEELEKVPEEMIDVKKLLKQLTESTMQHEDRIANLEGVAAALKPLVPFVDPLVQFGMKKACRLEKKKAMEKQASTPPGNDGGNQGDLLASPLGRDHTNKLSAARLSRAKQGASKPPRTSDISDTSSVKPTTLLLSPDDSGARFLNSPNSTTGNLNVVEEVSDEDPILSVGKANDGTAKTRIGTAEGSHKVSRQNIASTPEWRID